MFHHHHHHHHHQLRESLQPMDVCVCIRGRWSVRLMVDSHRPSRPSSAALSCWLRSSIFSATKKVEILTATSRSARPSSWDCVTVCSCVSQLLRKFVLQSRLCHAFMIIFTNVTSGRMGWIHTSDGFKLRGYLIRRIWIWIPWMY